MSFDSWHVTRSPPSGNVFGLGGITKQIVSYKSNLQPRGVMGGGGGIDI